MPVIIAFMHGAGLDRIVACQKRTADLRSQSPKRRTEFNAPMMKGMSR
jgi:hypothetical protein